MTVLRSELPAAMGAFIGDGCGAVGGISVIGFLPVQQDLALCAGQFKAGGAIRSHQT
jgi:hypothetical protein